MNFKSISGFLSCLLLFALTACSDTDKEKELVDQFTTASQDLIAISFPGDSTEDVVSINTFVDYRVEGLKSNGIDTIAISDNTTWSLSPGATSSIDQNGQLRSGSVAEVITITAKFGVLTTSVNITVSAAKFDQVTQLNSTPVLVNMCQAQQIIPIGSYLNDDGTEEIRPVDNTIINTITWIIKNQEDDSPSQRALIKTENDITELQALETGDVIIQAKATSLSSGNIITSAGFSQTLDHNLNSIKLCLRSETDLATCSFSTSDIVEQAVVSLMAVGNYQAADGSTLHQNISTLTKWGIDNNNNASIAFSDDRQQVNVTGNIAGTTANITTACGNIEQPVLDSEIENGVILDIAVNCASGNINCLESTATINTVDVTVTSLTVTANGLTLVNDTALALSSSPTSITLNVTADYSDDSSLDVTADSNVIYNNRSVPVILSVPNTPGEYTVLTTGEADIQIAFENQIFIAKITIP